MASGRYDFACFVGGFRVQHRLHLKIFRFEHQFYQIGDILVVFNDQ